MFTLHKRVNTCKDILALYMWLISTQRCLTCEILAVCHLDFLFSYTTIIEHVCMTWYLSIDGSTSSYVTQPWIDGSTSYFAQP